LSGIFDLSAYLARVLGEEKEKRRPKNQFPLSLVAGERLACAGSKLGWNSKETSIAKKRIHIFYLSFHAQMSFSA